MCTHKRVHNSEQRMKSFISHSFEFDRFHNEYNGDVYVCVKCDESICVLSCAIMYMRGSKRIYDIAFLPKCSEKAMNNALE